MPTMPQWIAHLNRASKTTNDLILMKNKKKTMPGPRPISAGPKKLMADMIGTATRVGFQAWLDKVGHGV